MSKVYTLKRFINHLRKRSQNQIISFDQSIFKSFTYVPTVGSLIKELETLDPNKKISVSESYWDEEDMLRIVIDYTPEEKERIKIIESQKRDPNYIINELENIIENSIHELINMPSFLQKSILMEKVLFKMWKKEIINLSKLDDNYGRNINYIFLRWNE